MKQNVQLIKLTPVVGDALREPAWTTPSPPPPAFQWAVHGGEADRVHTRTHARKRTFDAL